ncbi:MAG: SIMPL domain-containing protein [Microgenomates group bacterium]
MNLLKNFFIGILIGGVFLLAIFFLPWEKVNWGKISFVPSETVTVTGMAKTTQKTEIAIFTAGVTTTNPDKQKAIDEVSQKMEGILKAVKEFGIPDKDIKTQSFNVYQEQESYWEGGVQKYRPGNWRVDNSVEIKLRDVDKASALSSVLSKSGATSIWGPSFGIESPEKVDEELIKQAMENALQKAQAIAQKSGKKLGKVLSVSEGYSSPVYPVFRAEGGAGGGGIPFEPGTETIQKTLTVTFELK